MGSWWDPAELDAVVQQEGVAVLLDRLDAALARDQGAALYTLREAVAMSAAVLVEDPAQLPAQLVGQINPAQLQDTRQFRRIEGIINSMTPQERAEPELIKASRKRRIAAGAGVPVQEVNRLLNQFEQMQKMMKMMKGGNLARMMRGMKGMLPGMR